MNENNKMLLDGTLTKMIGQIDNFDPGSKERAALVMHIVNLMKVDNEDEKIATEASIEAYKRGMESEKLEFERQKFELEVDKLKFEREKLKATSELEKEKIKSQMEIEKHKADLEFERQKLEREKLEAENKAKLEQLALDVKHYRKELIFSSIGLGLQLAIGVGVPMLKMHENEVLQARSMAFETDGSFTTVGSKAWGYEKI